MLRGKTNDDILLADIDCGLLEAKKVIVPKGTKVEVIVKQEDVTILSGYGYLIKINDENMGDLNGRYYWLGTGCVDLDKTQDKISIAIMNANVNPQKMIADRGCPSDFGVEDNIKVCNSNCEGCCKICWNEEVECNV